MYSLPFSTVGTQSGFHSSLLLHFPFLWVGYRWLPNVKSHKYSLIWDVYYSSYIKYTELFQIIWKLSSIISCVSRLFCTIKTSVRIEKKHQSKWTMYVQFTFFVVLLINFHINVQDYYFFELCTIQTLAWTYVRKPENYNSKVLDLLFFNNSHHPNSA